MSYDITIQGDNTFSIETDLASLEAFLRTIPEMIWAGERQFEWGDDAQYVMLGYLEYVDEEGNNIEEDGDYSGRVNCINAAIASAHISPGKARRYFAVCTRIANHLGWQAYDNQ